jgi:hypothetical protein
MLNRRSLLMSLIGLTARNLTKISRATPAIPSGKRVVIVTADWCPACKVIKGVVSELASHGQWKVGKAKDSPHVIIADPEAPDGWTICKALDAIGSDGMVIIPRIYVTVDGATIAKESISRKSQSEPWKLATDGRLLTSNNLADWINEHWNRS